MFVYIFASGDLFDHSCGLQMYDICDDSAELNDIPDNLSNKPQNNYPLVITFRKFLMMLDGTLVHCVLHFLIDFMVN